MLPVVVLLLIKSNLNDNENNDLAEVVLLLVTDIVMASTVYTDGWPFDPPPYPVPSHPYLNSFAWTPFPMFASVVANTSSCVY